MIETSLYIILSVFFLVTSIILKQWYEDLDFLSQKGVGDAEIQIYAGYFLAVVFAWLRVIVSVF